MKKLIIHIGTHKTGTTAIQSFTRANKKLFNRNDYGIIYYADLPLSIINKFSLSKHINYHEIDILKKFLSDKIKGKYDNYFLSWEGFSGDMASNYRNIKVVSTMLAKAIPDKVLLEIIIFFRRQDDFVQSAYAQFMYTGKFNDFKSFLAQVDRNNLDWNKFIQRIEEAFPKDTKLHILPYDAFVLKGKNIINLIGEVLMLNDLKQLKSIPQKNVGMSEASAILYERLNSKIEHSPYQLNLLRKHLQQTGNKGFLIEYNYMNDNEKEHFLAYFNRQNKILANKYWNEKFNIDNFSMISKAEISNDEKSIDSDELIMALLKEIEEIRINYSRNLILKLVNRISAFLNI